MTREGPPTHNSLKALPWVRCHSLTTFSFSKSLPCFEKAWTARSCSQPRRSTDLWRLPTLLLVEVLQLRDDGGSNPHLVFHTQASAERDGDQPERTEQERNKNTFDWRSGWLRPSCSPPPLRYVAPASRGAAPTGVPEHRVRGCRLSLIQRHETPDLHVPRDKGGVIMAIEMLW